MCPHILSELKPLTAKLMMEEICFCWLGIIERSQEQSFSSCILHIALHDRTARDSNSSSKSCTVGQWLDKDLSQQYAYRGNECEMWKCEIN